MGSVQSCDTNPGFNGLSGRDARSANSASTAQLQQQQLAQQQASGQRRPGNDVESNQERHDDVPEDYYISDLYNQLSVVISAKPTDIEPLRIGSLHI